MDEWIPINISSLAGLSHSMSATTSSSSSSSSLSVSSPRSYASIFCCFFFLTTSFVFLYHSVMARLAAVTNRSFGNGAERSIKMSIFGWSRYRNINIKGSGVQ